MKTTRDILIVGGGVIGLAIAFELRRHGAKVTVISKDFVQAAGNAAAGMLAPMAEKLTSKPMLELCLRSRWLYPEWAQKLEELTGIDIGYLPCGILAPVYSLPESIVERDNALWLDRETTRLYEPGLSDLVVGSWWHPEDGQVDNRCLMQIAFTGCSNFGRGSKRRNSG